MRPVNVRTNVDRPINVRTNVDRPINVRTYVDRPINVPANDNSNRNEESATNNYVSYNYFHIYFPALLRIFTRPDFLYIHYI